MNKTKRNIFIIIISILTLLAAGYLAYKIIPLFSSLKSIETQQKLEKYILDKGWKGWGLLLIIQILQIFIAFIPGEIVEIVSGLLYGPIGGLFICLLGILLGSLLIYYTVKLLAKSNLNKYKSKLQSYTFLNNPKKIHIYLFILFLLPGIPKDIFIYTAPFLPIEFTNFLIISLVARIPSILSSTIIGNSLMEGNYLTSIIVFSTFALIGIIVILFKDKLFNIFKKHEDKDTNTIEN